MARHGSGGGNTSSPRIAASLYWFFTYNNYKQEDVALLSTLFDEQCEWYVFQEELGAEGTPHLQGTIKAKKKIRPIETFSIKEIHWEKTKAIKNAQEYCSKIETRIGKVYSKGVEYVPLPEIYGWQQMFIEMLNKFEERKIYWFFEEHGGVGKTDLCRYMALKYKALIIGGKASDMKCAIAQMEIKPKICILNVPRASNGYVSYQGLEEVSDGLFFSGKYESGMVIFNRPIMIVFANEPPDVSKMSLDRWVIHKIVGNKLVKENARPQADLARELTC